ncbi:MAG: ribonuclease H-like domain-containing protein [Candidatus Absconditabacterales bacterium]
MRQENAGNVKDFLKSQFTFGNQTYYRDGTNPVFRFTKEHPSGQEYPSYIFVDEREKIELYVDNDTIKNLTNKLKSDKVIPKGDSLLDILFKEYQEGGFRTILGKPYVVYDIETLYATMNLKGLAFELGYTITSSDTGESFDKQFKYIEKQAIQKYVDFLLDFDGYIIGFNNIGFDNIVIGYNAGYTEEIINRLHAKSIDLFYYLRNLTNKRMGLNKVATALVGLQKTLSGGGSEGSDLLKDWLSTGNAESLKKVKEYCKGDVKMTLGVLLYLYKFGEFFIDGEQYCFNEDEFFSSGRDIKKQNVKESNNDTFNGLF